MNGHRMFMRYWMCLVLAVMGVVQTAIYLTLELPDWVAVVYVVLVYAALILWCAVAVQSRLPWLFLPPVVACGILTNITNFRGLVVENAWYLADALICAAAFVVEAVLWWKGKYKPARPHWSTGLLLLLVAVGWVGTWRVSVAMDAGGQSFEPQVWAVPEVYLQPCQQAGVVEEITYTTYAYATDGREVEKTAYVYVPYGYDESQEYDILYLMHGTGDTQAHWLLEHPENKHMLDQLMAQGEIKPMLVVTPTFYVEEDCTGSQEQLNVLTRSFAQEIRKDLMPAVERQYATYAQSLDEAGFQASRDHRAFAGLSRGAMTACYSGLAENLDVFSWFGAFSGSRMRTDFFQALGEEDVETYPIHYLYMSTGSFDFLLPEQIKDYRNLLEQCPALTEGENTMFQVFPMRYHSWGNWNLALYNFLQHLFV